jgi:hypothetical protein
MSYIWPGPGVAVSASTRRRYPASSISSELRSGVERSVVVSE